MFSVVINSKQFHKNNKKPKHPDLKDRKFTTTYFIQRPFLQKTKKTTIYLNIEIWVNVIFQLSTTTLNMYDFLSVDILCKILF